MPIRTVKDHPTLGQLFRNCHYEGVRQANALKSNPYILGLPSLEVLAARAANNLLRLQGIDPRSKYIAH